MWLSDNDLLNCSDSTQSLYNQSNPHLFTGSHTGGSQQVAVNRRRDLGQDHRPGEKQTGGQGLRQGAGSDSERLWWRLRWVQDRPGRVRQPHERREDRRCQETHWPGKTWQAVRGRSWGFALQCRATRWHLIDRTLAGCRRLLLLAWLLHLVVSPAPGRYYNKEQRGGGGGGGQAWLHWLHSLWPTDIRLEIFLQPGAAANTECTVQCQGDVCICWSDI